MAPLGSGKPGTWKFLQSCRRRGEKGKEGYSEDKTLEKSAVSRYRRFQALKVRFGLTTEYNQLRKTSKSLNGIEGRSKPNRELHATGGFKETDNFISGAC